MRSLRKVIGLVVILIAFAVASTTCALAQQQKRLAFVIGNAAYPSDALVTSANDAGLIAQTLQAAGFDVVGARDVDQESLRGALRDFLGKVSAAGPDATVFVYLAGRGVQFEGENYFLPVDAQIANPADVPLQAMRLSDITKSLAGLPAKVNIVVLDAARPNGLPKMSQPLAGGLALVDPDPNMLIAFNAAPGTVAPEGKGPYGAYAQALAEMMREGGIALDDVFDRTRLRVNEVTQGAEIPWDASKISAPFVFFERAPDAPPPKVSEAEERANRTRPIRDFNAHDAYVAALDRDTMRGYEEFLVAYPHDPMAKRVRAIIAARREAITWRETWLRDTPEAYWSYLERYPHGLHAWDARRRLEHFDAELEPPTSFTVIVYDVPPPPPEEIIYVDRPVLYFDDPDFDFEPPPPIDVIFLPPPPPDFVVLPPPPPPVDVYVLPTPVFVPVPVWVRPPRDIAPPPNDIIFNNIHNTTVINNNTTINNEPANQARQPNANAPSGLTTGQKMAVGAGAASLAAKVALPPLLQKRAALFKQNQGGQPLKPGQAATQGQQPGETPQSLKPGQAVTQGQQPGVTPQARTMGKLSTDHALPGADGRALPLVNGKPVLNGQNAPNRRVLGKQGPVSGNQQATGNAGPPVTGNDQQNGVLDDQGKKNKFRKLPTVNGAPGENGQNAQQRFGKNNANALSGQNEGRPRKLTRKDLSAGQTTVGPSDQATVNGGDRGKKLRKLPTVNGAPAENGQNAQQRFGKNNPNALSGQNEGRPRKLTRKDLSGGQTALSPSDQGSVNGGDSGKKFRKLPTVNGAPADNRASVQERLRRNNPSVFSDQNQGSANANRKFRRLPNGEEGSAGAGINVQRSFKQERPNVQVLRPQRPEFQAQPRPQIQERRLQQLRPEPQMQERRLQQQLRPQPQIQERRLPQQPKEQPPQGNKKPTCGRPGEPPCQQ
ncbi:caspase domain-containing protein [Mesorhizobium sp. WSM4313]|uniref:caspase family protein n=1 Tax=Mesorhizobium sp. WSM4313 TaxID=2029412 RepID=UPI000BAF0B3F|nr:caspase domain-containing protein [Mesorhizobium sp. WSM4313]PBB19476.1 peptidase C14 caspase catalytic subunit p20 [Mesorhizobium sp. WSM4313]